MEDLRVPFLFVSSQYLLITIALKSSERRKGWRWGWGRGRERTSRTRLPHSRTFLPWALSSEQSSNERGGFYAGAGEMRCGSLDPALLSWLVCVRKSEPTGGTGQARLVLKGRTVFWQNCRRPPQLRVQFTKPPGFVIFQKGLFQETAVRIFFLLTTEEDFCWCLEQEQHHQILQKCLNHK